MEARPKAIKTIRQLWVVPAMVSVCFLLVFYLLPPASAQVGPQSTNSLRTTLSPRIENLPGVQRFSTPSAAVTPEPKDPPQAVELRATLAISTSDEQPQPQSDVLAAQNREALLLEAARNAFERQLSSGSDFRIGQLKIIDDWALVNFRVSPPDLVDMPQSWDIYLGLARWNDIGWEVRLENSSEFLAWLDQIPPALISIEARSFFEPQISQASDAPGLLLPFPIGQTWKFLAGPFGGPRREAVDFGPFGVRERITPEPPPTAPFTGRERDVTAAAAGVVIDKSANLLILRHGDFPAWETGYYSLAQASNIKQVGDFVFRGERIGSASNEVDPLLDERVQFWVRRRGVDQVIDGQILSEWRVYQDNGFETGQNAGRIVYKNGAERIDCLTVEKNDLEPEQCHVKHYSVTPSPLATSTITISPSAGITIPVGLTGISEVIVEDVTNLFRVNLSLTYSPVAALSVVDAFPAVPGIQVAPGKIFENQPSTFISNNVDAEAGVIEFEADLQVPAFAFSGTNSLIEIAWQRDAVGEVELKLDQVILADPNGRTLPVVVSPADEIKIQSGFLLNGQVELQGRSRWDNVSVASSEQQVKTAAEGLFSLGVRGPYQLSVTAPGYVSAEAVGDPVKRSLTEVELIDLGRFRLLGGEVTGDDQIDIFDLSYIGSRFGGTDERADINGDGLVDIFDLTLAAANFGQSGPKIITGE